MHLPSVPLPSSPILFICVSFLLLLIINSPCIWKHRAMLMTWVLKGIESKLGVLVFFMNSNFDSLVSFFWFQLELIFCFSRELIFGFIQVQDDSSRLHVQFDRYTCFVKQISQGYNKIFWLARKQYGAKRMSRFYFLLIGLGEDAMVWTKKKTSRSMSGEEKIPWLAFIRCLWICYNGGFPNDEKDISLLSHTFRISDVSILRVKSLFPIICCIRQFSTIHLDNLPPFLFCAWLLQYYYILSLPPPPSAIIWIWNAIAH